MAEKQAEKLAQKQAEKLTEKLAWRVAPQKEKSNVQPGDAPKGRSPVLLTAHSVAASQGSVQVLSQAERPFALRLMTRSPHGCQRRSWGVWCWLVPPREP